MPRSRILARRAGLLLIAALATSACAQAATTPSPSIAASPTPEAEPVAGGTITLTDASCAWDGNPGSVAGAPVAIDVRNETADYGAFFVHRLKPEFTWQDGVDAIAAIQAAMAAGEDWPNWASNLSSVQGEAFAEAGERAVARIPALTGIYGVVCSANTSASGEVLTVFLAGPLEVTR